MDDTIRHDMPEDHEWSPPGPWYHNAGSNAIYRDRRCVCGQTQTEAQPVTETNVPLDEVTVHGGMFAYDLAEALTVLDEAGIKR